MYTIRYYEIDVSTNHGEPCGQFVFYNHIKQTVECSSLLSIPELNNLVKLIDQGASRDFAEGWIIGRNSSFQLITRG